MRWWSILRWPMLVGACCMLLGACAPLPQRAGIPTLWSPSPNYDQRRPNFVVIHHTGSPAAARALATLRDPLRKVSAHYLIARDGTIHQLVDERARAWHAGQSRWGGHDDLNSASIGIELDNDGDEPFAELQIGALLALLRDVLERNRIPPANVLGHGDVAPGRKVDPSRHFPWALLARHGFGVWCDPPPTLPAPVGVVPDDRAGSGEDGAPDDALLLQALGYDVSDPGAAARAFRRHFRQDEGGSLSPEDRELLACLVERARVQPPRDP
jgi:N-acetylmuramoyl-L-alanine amidase